MIGRERSPRPKGAAGDRTGVVAIGVTLLAIVGCAAGPAILVVVGSVALGALVGWAAGAAVLVAVGAAFAASRCRRHDRSASGTLSQVRR